MASRYVHISFFSNRRICSIDLAYAAVFPAPRRRAQRGRQLAEGQARVDRHTAGVPPVWLCRHRQDHARPPFGRTCRRRGEVRRLHRQGGLRDARQRLQGRLHHPLAHLPRARERRGNPLLRPVGRGARLQGRADRHRRMLDGGRRARPRPVVVRRAGAGAGGPRAIAADPGRRLLHRGGAGRDAHRSAPAGDRRSDRASVDGHPRRRISRARPLRRNRSGRQGRSRSAARARGRPGAGRPQRDAARLQHPHARAPRLRGQDAVGRRQTGVPAQQPQEGPVQRLALVGEGTRRAAHRHHDHAAFARRRERATRGESLGAAGMFFRRHRADSIGRAASRTTSSTTAMCSRCTRRKARNGTTWCCSTRASRSPTAASAGSIPA